MHRISPYLWFIQILYTNAIVLSMHPIKLQLNYDNRGRIRNQSFSGMNWFETCWQLNAINSIGLSWNMTFIRYIIIICSKGLYWKGKVYHYYIKEFKAFKNFSRLLPTSIQMANERRDKERGKSAGIRVEIIFFFSFHYFSLYKKKDTRARF